MTLESDDVTPLPLLLASERASLLRRRNSSSDPQLVSDGLRPPHFSHNLALQHRMLEDI
jgi:hypothetical protein